MSKVKTIIDGSLFRELSMLTNPHHTCSATKETLQQFQDDARAIIKANGYNTPETYIISRKKLKGVINEVKVSYTESEFEHFFKPMTGKKFELSYRRFTSNGLTEDTIEILNSCSDIKEAINHTTKDDDKNVNEHSTTKSYNKIDEILPEW